MLFMTMMVAHLVLTYTILAWFTPLFQLHRTQEFQVWYARFKAESAVCWACYKAQCERDWAKMAEQQARDPSHY